MFNFFALLRDDPLKPVTPLTNGAIDETLQQFSPLGDDCLLQLVDCLESSMLTYLRCGGIYIGSITRFLLDSDSEIILKMC